MGRAIEVIVVHRAEHALAVRPRLSSARAQHLHEALSNHAEAEVCRPPSRDHPGAFEGDRAAEVVEHPDAIAQQHRDQVDLDLVEQAERECLLRHLRPV